MSGVEAAEQYPEMDVVTITLSLIDARSACFHPVMPHPASLSTTRLLR